MYEGKLVFSQIMDFVPRYEFDKLVKKYDGNYKVRKYTCWQHYLSMSFAQLTYRESLRDLVTCLNAIQTKQYHLGFRTKPVRSTISDANEKRDWRIYAEYGQILIHQARDLYKDSPNVVNLEETVYALDSSTIDLCMTLFPWARFRKRKSAIKLHTLLDLRGNIPSFIEITDGKVHDVNILDILPLEAGSFYVIDRGYLDFSRLHKIKLEAAWFLVRAKTNTKTRRLYSKSVDKSCGLKYDQTVRLTGFYTKKEYPGNLRQIKYFDQTTQKTFIFLTNNFELPAFTITKLYKSRWQIELFFKWIKQHLRIKSFFGTSENAVKSQVWIAISTYVLVAIIKKRLKLQHSLYTILQILSISILDNSSINQLLTRIDYKQSEDRNFKQLNLFDL